MVYYWSSDLKKMWSRASVNVTNCWFCRGRKLFSPGLNAALVGIIADDLRAHRKAVNSASRIAWRSQTLWWCWSSIWPYWPLRKIRRCDRWESRRSQEMPRRLLKHAVHPPPFPPPCATVLSSQLRDFVSPSRASEGCRFLDFCEAHSRLYRRRFCK